MPSESRSKKLLSDAPVDFGIFRSPLVETNPGLLNLLGQANQKTLTDECLHSFRNAKFALDESIADIATEDKAALDFAHELATRVLTILEIGVELGYLKVDEIEASTEKLEQLGVTTGPKTYIDELKQKIIKTKIISTSNVTEGVDKGNISDAGFVGFSPLAIEHAAQGNIRESLYIPYKFRHELTKQLFSNPEQIHAINLRLIEKGKSWQLNEEFINELSVKTKSQRDGVYSYGAYASARGKSRRSKSQQEKEEYLKSNQSISELEKARVPLSEREILAQAGDLKVGKEKKVQWLPGEAWYEIDADSSHPSITEAGLAHEKMLTGISGTTDNIITLGFMTGIFDGVDAEEKKRDALVACLGWMVDSKDHSAYEILTSGKSFNLNYQPGVESHKQIRPGNQDFIDAITRAQLERGFLMPEDYLSEQYVLKKAFENGMLTSTQIIELVRLGEMKPEIVIKAFPDNEQIVGAIYEFLSQQHYSSQAQIIESIHEGKITPDVAVQSYPDNIDIVQAAYLKSPESIRFAQKECINQLGSQGVISKEDVLKIFNMTEMTIDEEEQIHDDFRQALLTKDWSTVARISQMFWFEKPEGVTHQSIINYICITLGMKEFYDFEQAFNQEQIDITYGPLPKDIETIQLEMLMRKFLVNEHYEIETRPDGDYFVFHDGEAFNWTKIRAGANLQHVQLNEEDMLAYRQINTNSTDTTSFLLPEKEEEYRNQLYQYYDEHHIPRPDPPISFSEMQAINIYTGGFYEQMNGLMRDDPKKFDYRNSSEQNKSLTRLALINSVMCASGLRKISETNIPVSYRGAKIGDKEEFSERVRAAHHHGVVELSGFISTSINQSLAFGHKAVHYTFHNLRGAYIAPISKVEAIRPEQEFLIPQTQVRLTHYEYKNGKHHFDATLVEDLNYSQKKKFKRLIDFSSLKFTDTITLIKLIRESKIQAIDMIPFFKNDNEIILECFKANPAIITYVEKEKVLELLKSGGIQANLVINFFQKDKDIILACYQQDKNSITYGDLNKIFELYVDGLIDEVDLMKCCSSQNVSIFELLQNCKQIGIDKNGLADKFCLLILKNPNSSKEMLSEVISYYFNDKYVLGLFMHANMTPALYEKLFDKIIEHDFNSFFNYLNLLVSTSIAPSLQAAIAAVIEKYQFDQYEYAPENINFDLCQHLIDSYHSFEEANQGSIAKFLNQYAKTIMENLSSFKMDEIDKAMSFLSQWQSIDTMKTFIQENMNESILSKTLIDEQSEKVFWPLFKILILFHKGETSLTPVGQFIKKELLELHKTGGIQQLPEDAKSILLEIAKDARAELGAKQQIRHGKYSLFQSIKSPDELDGLIDELSPRRTTSQHRQ